MPLFFIPATFPVGKLLCYGIITLSGFIGSYFTYNALKDKFSSSELDFYGVLPGNYSNWKDIPFQGSHSSCIQPHSFDGADLLEKVSKNLVINCDYDESETNLACIKIKHVGFKLTKQVYFSQEIKCNTENCPTLVTFDADFSNIKSDVDVNFFASLPNIEFSIEKKTIELELVDNIYQIYIAWFQPLLMTFEGNVQYFNQSDLKSGAPISQQPLQVESPFSFGGDLVGFYGFYHAK